MNIQMGINPTSHDTVGLYDGHCHPSSLDGQGWHALAGTADLEPERLGKQAL
jgi:hypothetical protein